MSSSAGQMPRSWASSRASSGTNVSVSDVSSGRNADLQAWLNLHACRCQCAFYKRVDQCAVTVNIFVGALCFLQVCISSGIPNRRIASNETVVHSRLPVMTLHRGFTTQTIAMGSTGPER